MDKSYHARETVSTNSQQQNQKAELFTSQKAEGLLLFYFDKDLLPACPAQQLYYE